MMASGYRDRASSPRVQRAFEHGKRLVVERGAYFALVDAGIGSREAAAGGDQLSDGETVAG